MNKSTSVEDMQRIINQSGGEAVEIAKCEIASKFYSKDEVSRALRYFAKVTLPHALPVFPAFVSLACEVVGGKTDKARSVGAAISLMAWAADLHDDVIDQSPIKNGKHTVFGEFGTSVTILAGDALLVLGLSRLQKECASISPEQRDKILDLATYATLEMSRAEALEARLRATKNHSIRAGMKVIEMKSVVPEICMRIGSILGGGNSDMIETLGHFGRVFGVVSSVTEEFMDVLEIEELKNRILSNYPPLPFLYALNDPALKADVVSLSDELTSKEHIEELQDLLLKATEVNTLEKKMNRLVLSELDCLCSKIGDTDVYKKLEITLTSSLELLEMIQG